MKCLDYNALFKNNREWIKQKLDFDKNYFKDLSKGQNPEYLMIGCSDSRVPLSSLLYAEPGEIFVHRNIANLVNIGDMNFLSVLEYSIEHLQIKHIIVVGHYKCGGVNAAIDGVDQGLIENWVAPVKDLYLKNKLELDKIADNDKRADRLSEINVVAQVKNIFKTPVMQSALENNNYPLIHGWIFDIYTGKIIDMKLPVLEWKQAGLIPEKY